MSRAVCTIVTKSHLAYARALARSLHEHEPDLTFYCLLADAVDGYFVPEREPFELLTLEDLGFRETISRMSFYYTAFELCNAIRPLLHDYILTKTEHESWLYLDSDIIVCSRLDPVFEALCRSPLLLSPHFTVMNNRSLEIEIAVVKYGIYNSGCLGLRRSPLAERFVEWFRNRLEYYALNRDRLFVDQAWLNLVPTIFPEARELRHPGANVGYWNLHERTVTSTPSGEYLANGEPLLFAHFSGGDLENQDRIFRDKRFDAPLTDALKSVFQKYVHHVTTSGLDTTSRWPYAFNHFADGSEITPAMRQIYYEDCLSGVGSINDPFNQGEYFRHRSAKPRKGLGTRVRDLLRFKQKAA